MEAILHQGQQCIGIRFANRLDLRVAISRIPSVKWSYTNRCWLLPLSRQNYQRIVAACSGLAVVDHSALKQYLLSRKEGFQDTLNDILIPAQEVSSLPDGPTGLSIHPGAASLAGKRPQPKEFLFESEQTFTAYPVRTVQQIFSNAKNRAGIRKEIGIHSLRIVSRHICWIRVQISVI